jgi:hypothetical protein
MLPVLFYKRLFILLFAGFIISVVAGTLSHECGHYFVARFLGYKGGHISYAFTYYGHKNPDSNFFNPSKKYMAYEKNNRSFPKKEEYEKLKADYMARNHKESTIITAAGPLETMLAGSIGVFLLFYFRKGFFAAVELRLRQWIIVFLALFWLREPFNLLLSVGLKILNKMPHMKGDEFRISEALGMNQWVIIIIAAIAGTMVLWLVAFKFVPPRLRLTFLTAGFTGAVTGAILWLVLLGPVILP